MHVTHDPRLFCGHVPCAGAAVATMGEWAAGRCELCPLAVFHQLAKQPLPATEVIDAADIPQPYRHLLVHQRDMTSTLQTHHGARTHLKVLQQREANGLYQRAVVLALDGSNQPVEFGAITIELAVLPVAAQHAVIAARRPLGGILSEHGVEFISRPKVFFRMTSDALISDALGLSKTEPHDLYGRCNALWNPEGGTIADIVEILPPGRK